MERREIKITTPCEVDWESMTPADKGRFCGECKKVVRNLSDMTEREARSMIQREGNNNLCVRFLYDKHGKVFFAGDRKQLIPAGLLSRTKRAALAAAAIASGVALTACELPQAMGISPSSEEQKDEDELYPLQGGMESLPPEHNPPTDADGGADGGDGSADAKADATPTEAGPDAEADADGGVIPIN